LINTKSSDEWANLFTVDAELQYPVALEDGTARVLRGRDELRAGPGRLEGKIALITGAGP
jgi:hypothetical protein